MQTAHALTFFVGGAALALLLWAGFSPARPGTALAEPSPNRGPAASERTTELRQAPAAVTRTGARESEPAPMDDPDELQRRFLAGQLRALGGEATPWPEDTPPAYSAESVRSLLEQAVVARGLGSLVAMDCDEFPCLALVEQDALSEGWMDTVRSAIGERMGESYPEGTELGLWTEIEGSGEAQRGRVAVAVTPPGQGDEVGMRLNTRARDLMAASAE